ncbi:MAG: nickel-binding protein [Bacteroidota bacterium]
MPLYMDIHTVDSDTFSVEDVVKAHMEDLAIQEQFDVIQLKYWVNVEAKTLFCLMEGPNREACNQVHKQSHGNTACNIIEVSDNEFNLFMGEGTDVNDLAQTNSGELDTGYRTIMLTNIVCFLEQKSSYLEEIHEIIIKNNGVIIPEPDNQIMVSFIYATDAISCAASIKKILGSKKDAIEFNLAVVSGRPVDEEGDNFFEETKLKVNILCSLGLSRKMYLDSATNLLSDKESPERKEDQPGDFTLVKDEDLKLLMELSETINSNFNRSGFKSEDLTALLGLSKSQAYRKIKFLTGMAPNQLIQEFRLQKAISHIMKSKKTMAEIAYESGFNSPTYFTRVFKKRFGISPTDFAGYQQ